MCKENAVVKIITTMNTTWHKYLEETNVESLSTSKFLKAWNNDEKDPDQIAHCKDLQESPCDY